MKNRLLIIFGAVLAVAPVTVEAGGRHCNNCQNGGGSGYRYGHGFMHGRNVQYVGDSGYDSGAYYHAAWGVPLALVVPPTATRQWDYSWGVPSASISPINRQFRRGGFGGGGGGGGYSATPAWPSHTQQFGVYSVRGPWSY